MTNSQADALLEAEKYAESRKIRRCLAIYEKAIIYLNPEYYFQLVPRRIAGQFFSD